uniref:Uncharacterized protein n=1 Tax=Arundo donax TaxID=35708 RepID=A0A0A8Z4F2_ARUDO
MPSLVPRLHACVTLYF